MLHHALAQDPDHFDFAQIPHKIAPENSHNLTPQEPLVSTLLCSQSTNLSLYIVADDDNVIEMQKKNKNGHVSAVITDDGPAVSLKLRDRQNWIKMQKLEKRSNSNGVLQNPGSDEICRMSRMDQNRFKMEFFFTKT